MEFCRQIFYFHLYNGPLREKNVGFMKWTRADYGSRLEIQIKGLEITKTFVELYTETKEYLGKIEIINGSGTLRISSSGTSINGINLLHIHELYGNLENGKKIVCRVAEQEDEKTTIEIESETILSKVDSETVSPKVIEEILKEEESIFPQANEPAIVSAARTEPIQSYYLTPWEQMCRQFEIIKPFNHDETCIKLSPADFYIFRDSYEALSRNSFLLHGYYNYNYLILRKKHGLEEDAFYLGVPGIYHEREIMAAKMFGFEGFEGQQEEYSQGSFGYYMISVK